MHLINASQPTDLLTIVQDFVSYTLQQECEAKMSNGESMVKKKTNNTEKILI